VACDVWREGRLKLEVKGAKVGKTKRPKDEETDGGPRGSHGGTESAGSGKERDEEIERLKDQKTKAEA